MGPRVRVLQAPRLALEVAIGPESWQPVSREPRLSPVTAAGFIHRQC